MYFAYDVFVTFRMGPFVMALLVLEGLLTFITGSVIYYHSIRQLRLVSKIVNKAKPFNLFHLEPVYAFSALTAQTGIAWVILITLTLVVFPLELAPVPTLVLIVVQSVLATAAFVLPLRIVNQRLVAEKRRLLADHEQRVETTLAQLHRSIDDKEITEVADLNTVMSGLDAERTILEKIPTWPWRAGMLPGFLSIAVLPILLFLVQLVLGNLLSE